MNDMRKAKQRKAMERFIENREKQERRRLRRMKREKPIVRDAETMRA